MYIFFLLFAEKSEILKQKEKVKTSVDGKLRHYHF